MLNLSGERFAVLYSIAAASEQEARERAFSVAVEQTVEFPYELVPSTICEQVVGRVEGLEPASTGRWFARISYAVETTGFELTQLLNVMMGNSSIFPGVRVERFDLPGVLLGRFRGPRFGVQGLRAYLDVPERPLLSTALKPQGLSARELADLAYQFALGGIDIIKDDHGLADQPMAPFAERVARCAEAWHGPIRRRGTRRSTCPTQQALRIGSGKRPCWRRSWVLADF